jgi:CRP-like cAMP-binding protein
MYLIVCGQVGLSQGWEYKTVLRSGGALGENSVLGGDGSGTMLHTATALEPTELVVILRNDFEDLVANRPDFIPTYNLESWEKVSP